MTKVHNIETAKNKPQLIVFTFLIKYPSSNSFYLTSKSFLITSPDDCQKKFDGFKNLLETDNFKVVNMNALIIVDEDIKSIPLVESLLSYKSAADEALSYCLETTDDVIAKDLLLKALNIGAHKIYV